jgi:hypothetical protein
MNIEKLHQYLQTYLNDVVTPSINKKLVSGEDEPITLTVYGLRRGSYQPPIFHVFIDMDPKLKKDISKNIENNIISFFNIFSITDKVKIHWNKRPAF